MFGVWEIRTELWCVKSVCAASPCPDPAPLYVSSALHSVPASVGQECLGLCKYGGTLCLYNQLIIASCSFPLPLILLWIPACYYCEWLRIYWCGSSGIGGEISNEGHTVWCTPGWEINLFKRFLSWTTCHGNIQGFFFSNLSLILCLWHLVVFGSSHPAKFWPYNDFLLWHIVIYIYFFLLWPGHCHRKTSVFKSWVID